METYQVEACHVNHQMNHQVKKNQVHTMIYVKYVKLDTTKSRSAHGLVVITAENATTHLLVLIHNELKHDKFVF